MGTEQGKRRIGGSIVSLVSLVLDHKADAKWDKASCSMDGSDGEPLPGMTQVGAQNERWWQATADYEPFIRASLLPTEMMKERQNNARSRIIFLDPNWHRQRKGGHRLCKALTTPALSLKTVEYRG